MTVPIEENEGNPAAEETMHPAETPGTTPETPELDTPADGAPQTPTPEEKPYSKTASDFYKERDLKREERRLQLEKDKELDAFKQKLDAGEIQPSPETLHETVREKDAELRSYKLRDFMADHPHFKEHENVIKEAMDKPEFQNLSIEQIAYATAGAQLVEGKAADDEAARAKPATGMSPRNIKPKDYRDMSLEEVGQEATRILRQG